VTLGYNNPVESLKFSNKGVHVERVGDHVVKVVRETDEQLTGEWKPSELVDREVKALKLLECLPGIPRVVSRDRPDTFTMSFIPGKNLTEANISINENYFPRMRALLHDAGKRGVYRFGQGKRDYLVQPDGSPGVIDFGNVVFTKENPMLAMVAKVWTTLRLNDLERRFGPKKSIPSEEIEETEQTLVPENLV